VNDIDPSAPAAPVVILIADNDPGVRSVLRQVLAKEGRYSIEEAEDGHAARRRIELGGVALLVCDLDMPGLSGGELIASLQSEPQAPRVVVVSGFLDDVLERDLTGRSLVGAAFAKPFDVVEFAAAVRSLVDAPRSDPGREHGRLF
jgi:CheY-like chemotaxis protein